MDLFHTIKLLAQTVCLAQFRWNILRSPFSITWIVCIVWSFRIIFFFISFSRLKDDDSRGPYRLSRVSPQSFKGVVRGVVGWTDVVPHAYEQLYAESIDRKLIEFRCQVNKLTYVYRLSVRAVDWKNIRNKKSRVASITLMRYVWVICQKYSKKNKI